LVRKMAFFFKTNVAIQNFQKLAAIWTKYANFSAKVFGENILKIITTVPEWRKLRRNVRLRYLKVSVKPRVSTDCSTWQGTTGYLHNPIDITKNCVVRHLLSYYNMTQKIGSILFLACRVIHTTCLMTCLIVFVNRP
jgi:hypothetical protein